MWLAAAAFCTCVAPEYLAVWLAGFCTCGVANRILCLHVSRIFGAGGSPNSAALRRGGRGEKGARAPAPQGPYCWDPRAKVGKKSQPGSLACPAIVRRAQFVNRSSPTRLPYDNPDPKFLPTPAQ